ncbi:hypothetical protein QYM36_014441, partial [Artemia franciscana]
KLKTYIQMTLENVLKMQTVLYHLSVKIMTWVISSEYLKSSSLCLTLLKQSQIKPEVEASCNISHHLLHLDKDQKRKRPL